MAEPQLVTAEEADVRPAAASAPDLQKVREEQQQLRQAFERLAANLHPLLTDQYRATEARVRALETVIRNRRERPLIVLLANLLSDVRRLSSADDIRAHVEETISGALTGAGYQHVGAAGEPFDPARHEPLSGYRGAKGIVARVHRHGLECHGDVILKAQVDVEPAAPDETE